MANAAEHDDNYSLAGSLFFLAPFIIGIALGIFEVAKPNKPEPASSQSMAKVSFSEGSPGDAR